VQGLARRPGRWLCRRTAEKGNVMKKYVVVYCYKDGRQSVWKEMLIEAVGLYEASEEFFESKEIKAVYPTLKQVQFRHAECCGQCK
jgi:hypothetical protein